MFMPAEELVVHGAREHNLKDVTVRLPRNALDLRHGALRLGQVEPRLRHDLRRGPAPLRRVAVRLRAPVPADDGEARRRLDRRALARDLDRPEDDLAQPALDGRHRDRDLRLPAPALRARRPAALPGLRAADRRPVDRADRRPGARASRTGRASPSTRRSSATARASTGSSSRSCATEGFTRVKVDGEQRLLEEDDRARQEVQAHDRGRRRPARDEAGPAHAALAVGRDGGRARRGARRHRPGRRRARSCSSPSASRAPSTASRCRSSSRGSSPSTRPTAPARAAPGSARSRRSTLTCSSPTRACRSPTARSCPGRSATRRFYEAGDPGRSPTATRSTSTRRGSELDRPSSRTASSTARAATGSTSSTATGWAGGARTCSPSRGSSRTSSAATARRTPRSERERIEEYMSFRPCPVCKGARLKPEVLAVTVGDRNIHEFTRMSVTARARVPRRARADARPSS